MRSRAGLVLGLLLLLPAAGCGRQTDNGIATANGKVGVGVSASPLSVQESARKFSQCMRDNGIANYPDPKIGADGSTAFTLPEGADPQKVTTATQKCKRYLPNGGQPSKADAQQLAQQRKFAQCMRDHGLPDFPDPGADGAIKITEGGSSGLNPNDPTFQAAQKACSQFQPSHGPAPVQTKVNR